MAHHARVEELSDSDSDPEVMDISTLPPSQILQRVQQAPSARQQEPNSTLLSGHNLPFSSSYASPAAVSASQKVTEARPDHTWCMIYPLYFDKAASRAQGRRVGKEDAVANPLAKAICDALVGIPTARIAFEPGKRHPSDWANPGRVRVQTWDDRGKWILRNVKNKKALFIYVAEYLKAHPTTKSDPLKLPIRGMPMPDEDQTKPPAVPRGWRINDILPLHSPAMSGGGVSDNLMKDMQAMMRGEEPGAASSAQLAKAEKKKEKKEKKEMKKKK